jgi:hypothetical protein
MSLQNLENKGKGKFLPRKILHPKELDIKILHPKDLRGESRRQPRGWKTFPRSCINQMVISQRPHNWPPATGHWQLFFKDAGRFDCSPGSSGTVPALVGQERH